MFVIIYKSSTFERSLGRHNPSQIGAINRKVAFDPTLNFYEELLIRGTVGFDPIVQAHMGAMLFMILDISHVFMDADIADVIGISRVTIRGTYKDLHPYALRLIPNWYAKVEDLLELPAP